MDERKNEINYKGLRIKNFNIKNDIFDMFSIYL